MKKILSLLTILLLACMGAYSQAPGIFNYQGVARNSVGNVLVNKTITLRLTIHDGSAAGPVVYQESRTAVTNPFGLFNVQVGSPGGSNVTGTIAGVPWNIGAKFIQVEIDPAGGTSFLNIGTAQIASVPYAWYASVAGDLILPFLKTQSDAGTLFRINNSGSGISGAIMGTTSSNAGNAWGVHGQVNNTAAGGFSSGILGTNLSTTGNGIGVTGTQAGSGWGVYGTTPSGRGVYGATTSGVGVYGQGTGAGTGGFFTSASGLALHTSGGVRLTGINEALNRILVSDASGNALWQAPAAAGIVTGSGTLNFIPKWTPNGTNLGNSEIFDNGTLIGLGTVTPFNTQLHIASDAIGANGFPGIRLTNPSSAGTFGGLYMGLNFATGSQEVYIGTNENTNMGFWTNGANRINVTNDGLVGVNVFAPAVTSRMHVAGAGATGSILDRTTILTVGNLDGANGHGMIADGEWRAIWGRNTGTGSRFEATGIRGESGGSNYTNGAGVLGNATGTGNNNIGVSGIASGTPAVFNMGLRGQATGTTTVQNWGSFSVAGGSSGQNVAVGGQVPAGANNWAGAFFGRVAIIDGTQALNRVFTSDAFGTGSWQTIGAGVGIGGSGTLNYVSKWTPDGTNLGNSIIYDNASTTTIGGVGVFTANNTTTLRRTTASPNDASLSFVTASQGAGIYVEGGTDDMHITVNANAVSTGAKVMTFENTNLNVGIGTATPNAASKLHVDFGTLTSTASTILSQSNPTTNGNITGVYGRGGWYGVQGINDNTQSRGVSVGVQGVGGGSGYGTGYGIMGMANGTGATNYGLYGIASSGTNNIGLYAQGTQFAAVLNGITQAGTTTSNFSTINIGTTTGISQPSIAFDNGTGNYFNIHENTNGQLAFRANNLAPGTTGVIMTLEDNNLNVGINTATPSSDAKLHVEAYGGSASSTTRTSIFANGVTSAANGHGVIGDGEWRGVWGRNSSTSSRAEASGVRGQVTGTTYSTGFGVFGQATGTGSDNYGLYGEAANASGNNYAAWLNGTVRISDGTQGAGRVLTSDANGVASWQNQKVSIRARDLSVNVNVPDATITPITTQWGAIASEEGGANFNPVTGQYTITRAGTYQINAHLFWNTFSASGTASTFLLINGVVQDYVISVAATAASSYTGTSVSSSIFLNVGDIVSIAAFQRSLAPQSVAGPFAAGGGNGFSVTLVN